MTSSVWPAVTLKSNFLACSTNKSISNKSFSKRLQMQRKTQFNKHQASFTKQQHLRIYFRRCIMTYLTHCQAVINRTTKQKVGRSRLSTNSARCRSNLWVCLLRKSLRSTASVKSSGVIGRASLNASRLINKTIRNLNLSSTYTSTLTTSK